MATFAGIPLSGSTDYAPIKVAATVIGSGTTIHTATTDTVGFDDIVLFVTNTDTSARTLTIGWGGTTDPDHLICKAVSIPASTGPVPIVTARGRNGIVIKAAASVTNILLITGWCNRAV